MTFNTREFYEIVYFSLHQAYNSSLDYLTNINFSQHTDWFDVKWIKHQQIFELIVAVFLLINTKATATKFQSKLINTKSNQCQLYFFFIALILCNNLIFLFSLEWYNSVRISHFVFEWEDLADVTALSVVFSSLLIKQKKVKKSTVLKNEIDTINGL